MPLPLLAILGAAALAGGGQTLQAIPAMLPTKYDKYNKQRLAELEALQAGQGFGLTGGEARMMSQAHTEPALRALGMYNQPTASATGSTDFGMDYAKQLAFQTASAQAAGDIQSQAAQAVYAADQQKEAQQLGELEQRLGYQSGRRQEQLAAGLSIPANMLDAASQAQMMGKITNMPGGGAPSPQSSLNKLAGMPGGVQGETAPVMNPQLDPGDVPPAFANYQNDPQMQEYLTWLYGNQGAA